MMLPLQQGPGMADWVSPCSLFLQFGAEQQVGEEEHVTQFPGALHQLHHETISQQLPVLTKTQNSGLHQTVT